MLTCNHDGKMEIRCGLWSVVLLFLLNKVAVCSVSTTTSTTAADMSTTTTLSSTTTSTDSPETVTTSKGTSQTITFAPDLTQMTLKAGSGMPTTTASTDVVSTTHANISSSFASEPTSPTYSTTVHFSNPSTTMVTKGGNTNSSATSIKDISKTTKTVSTNKDTSSSKVLAVTTTPVTTNNGTSSSKVPAVTTTPVTTNNGTSSSKVPAVTTTPVATNNSANTSALYSTSTLVSTLNSTAAVTMASTTTPTSTSSNSTAEQITKRTATKSRLTTINPMINGSTTSVSVYTSSGYELHASTLTVNDSIGVIESDLTTGGSVTSSKGTTKNTKYEPGTAEKSTGYDRELAIIFGSACGLMLVVIIALCISRQRHMKKQEQFKMGGDDIEIMSSKF